MQDDSVRWRRILDFLKLRDAKTRAKQLVNDGLGWARRTDTKLDAYLKQAFFINTALEPGTNRLNQISKGLLDLMRNMIIVGGVGILAKRTSSRLMDTVFAFALCVLIAYCLSYSWKLAFRPFRFSDEERSAKWNTVAHRVLWFLLTVLVVLVVIFGVNQLIDAQAR